jgi:hypothetical protein
MTPGDKASPQIIEIKSTLGKKRFGQSQSHLGVISEFAWGPSKRAATNHFAKSTKNWLGELTRILAGRTKFKRSAKGIANG